MTKISELRPDCELPSVGSTLRQRIFVPSGDIDGYVSHPGNTVSRLTFVPSVFIS